MAGGDAAGESGSGRRLVVYLGPSMRQADAKKLLPQAEYCPPIRRGDLDALPASAIVGMVDGEFEQSLAVSPREIRNAVERGITILGSSSMGALRAAEVPGVIGVGRVFQMFKDGTIERDDEVALLFDPDSFRSVTEPMVNIRHAVERLVSAETIAASVGKRIVAAAARLHYRDRAYPRILREAGLGDRSDLADLQRILRSFDLKREDAQLLLERLPEYLDRRAPEPGAPVVQLSGPEYADQMTGAEAIATFDADAPVLLWESGDVVEFAALVRFLALTGKLLPAARRAVARFALDGNLVEVATPDGDHPDAQALLHDVQRSWGWFIPDEVTITLRDLGVGLDDLAVRLDEEAAGRVKVLGLVREGDPDFLKALRAELVMDDLALKREVLRLGSVRALAAVGRRTGATPTAPELERVRRALCRAHALPTWRDVTDALARVGLTMAETDALVDELALAHRAAAPLIERFDGVPPARRPKIPWPRLAKRLRLGRGRKAPGDPRYSLRLAAAEKLSRRLAQQIGVTRVGQIGELDELGIHISQAFRPNDNWSTTVGSGKGMTPAAARVGGVMEEVEKYCIEVVPEDDERDASHDELVAEGLNVIDPATLDLPFDSSYRPDRKLGWARALELLTVRPIWVPTALKRAQRVRNDVFYTERGGRKATAANGLGAGFTLEEAIVHAACEAIERHATRLAELQQQNPGRCGPWRYPFVDLATAPARVREIVGRVTKTGLLVKVQDITSEIRVPTFEARFLVDAFRGEPRASFQGWGAHPDPEVAMTMALFEAAQTKLGNIAGAREDLTITARSLGRHERSRPERAENIEPWLDTATRGVPFASLGGRAIRGLADEVAWLLERLVDAGLGQVVLIDLSRPELAPARVVKVVLPGIESNNPFFTGLRARALVAHDLLR